MQQLLLKSISSSLGGLESLEQEGSTFFVRLAEGTISLLLDNFLQSRPFIGMQSQAARNSGRTRITFPSLTRDMIHRLATVYFDTFNLFYPLLDRETHLDQSQLRRIWWRY